MYRLGEDYQDLEGDIGEELILIQLNEGSRLYNPCLTWHSLRCAYVYTSTYLGYLNIVFKLFPTRIFALSINCPTRRLSNFSQSNLSWFTFQRVVNGVQDLGKTFFTHVFFL